MTKWYQYRWPATNQVPSEGPGGEAPGPGIITLSVTGVSNWTG